MILHRYSSKHYDMISEWEERRGNALLEPEFLPTHGLVVEDVACGFLYCTDSAVGMIDVFVTNPEASNISRGKALHLITQNLIIWAKDLGLKRLVANTQVRGIRDLALKNKFQDIGEYSFLFREL